jgi:hypothetical protein
VKNFLLLMVAGIAVTINGYCLGDAVPVDLSNNSGLLATVTVNNVCNSDRDVTAVYKGPIQPSHNVRFSVNEGCKVEVIGFLMDGAKKVPFSPFKLPVVNFTNSIVLSIQKDGSKYVVKQK